MHQAGCGLMGELGAESIHAKVNSSLRTYREQGPCSKVEKYTARPLSKHITSYDISCATPQKKKTFDTKAYSTQSQFARIFKALKGYE